MSDAIDTPEDVSLADLPSPTGKHDLMAKFQPVRGIDVIAGYDYQAYDGSDAVMLSAETSVGKHPVAAVEYMVKIAEEVERGLRRRGFAEPMSIGTDDSEIVADAAPERADDRANFLVAEHLHEVGLFDVQQLTAERKDRLHAAIAALLGAAAGGVTFDEEQLGVFV